MKVTRATIWLYSDAYDRINCDPDVIEMDWHDEEEEGEVVEGEKAPHLPPIETITDSSTTKEVEDGEVLDEEEQGSDNEEVDEDDEEVSEEEFLRTLVELENADIDALQAIIDREEQ